MGEVPMTTPPPQQAGRTDLVLTILLSLFIAAGVGFSVALTAERTLWLDEVCWIRSAEETPYSVLLLEYRSTQDENHPPLSFVLMKLSISAASSDRPWVVRLIPLLAGMACIPLAYLLGRQCHSHLMGMCVAAGIAGDATLVDQNGQAKVFSLIALFTLLSLLATVAVVRDRVQSWRRAAVLGLVLGASLWNSQLALASWLAAAVALAAVIAVDRGAAPGLFRRQALNGLIAFGVAVLVGLRGLVDLALVRFQQGPATGGPRFGVIVEDIRASLPLALPNAYHGVGAAVAALGLFLLLRRQRLLVLPVVALAVSSLLLAYALRQRHPFFHARYLTPLVPCLWFGFAGYVTLPRWAAERVLAVTPLLVMLVLNLLADSGRLSTWRDDAEYQIAPFVESLRPEVRPGDRVYFSPSILHRFGRYAGLPVADRTPEAIPECEPGSGPPDSGSGTWLVTVRLISPADVERAKREARCLASLYRQPIDPAWLDARVRQGQSAAVRISADRISYYPPTTTP
jgi:hypothetical protein